MSTATIGQLPLNTLLLGTELMEISNNGVSEHILVSGLATFYQPISAKDIANGYAGLDGDTLLDVLQIPAEIPALNIADGSVDNAEFQYLDGLTSNIQTQFTAAEQLVNKGISNGYAGLDSSALLEISNFPSGSSLQVLRRNAANDSLEFAIVSGGGITSINADSNTIQTLTGTSNVITIIDNASGDHTFNVGSLVVLSDTPTTYTLGEKQSFTPSTTTSGLNVGSISGVPTIPAHGDIVYDTVASSLKAYINSTWISLGAPSGITSINADDTAAQVIAGTSNVIIVSSVSGTTTLDVGSNVAQNSDTLSFFASTTSAQLAGVISDETGTGSLVFAISPTIVTPNISSFTNATHNHEDDIGGGLLTAINALDATGTPSSNTFLRGDNTWSTPVDTSPPFTDTLSIVEGSSDATKELRFEVDGNTTAIIGVIATMFTTAKTISIPDATDTLMGKATTDIMTNKSYALGGTGNILTGTAAQFDTACTDDDFAYVSDNLSVFASTTSAQLAGVISDETGTGSLVFATSPTLSTPEVVDYIRDANSNKQLSFSSVSSAVNEITISNAITENDPSISVTGTDTDINLALTPKGTGTLNVSSDVFAKTIQINGCTSQTITKASDQAYTASDSGLDIDEMIITLPNRPNRYALIVFTPSMVATSDLDAMNIKIQDTTNTTVLWQMDHNTGPGGTYNTIPISVVVECIGQTIQVSYTTMGVTGGGAGTFKSLFSTAAGGCKIVSLEM